MSRIAKQPITLAANINIDVQGHSVKVKGPKGEMTLELHPTVNVDHKDNELNINPVNETSWAMAGTMRALLANVVEGVTNGFNKKLQLVGVGYRVAMKGKDLDLNLGFSHPVVYSAPDGITFETPSNTEIVVNGIDKQQVGQVAAEIRAIRPPEPYKGKGVKYADERLYRKEAKKA
ncbi:50S ribosomal protein L6 [Marinicella rhabdoformis]|uniref:50S ribosomal protein L6 n=1 Tax=Marinicella rhabdoformis TaxID=2580566 RepID=UPI0012AEDCE0|nr:50S ribosomal protein L6 [Marinicella rhabdoformis]